MIQSNPPARLDQESCGVLTGRFLEEVRPELEPFVP